MSSDICLEFVDTVRYLLEPNATAGTSDADEVKSGVFERSALAWFVRGSVLEVFNINTSFKLLYHNFHGSTRKSKTCTIECVEEATAFGRNLLAVGLRLDSEQSQVVLLALAGRGEVGRIDVQEDVNIIRFIDPSSCSIGLLSEFSGCLAVGTTDGKVIMVDLCLKLVDGSSIGPKIRMNEDTKRQCHIEFSRGEPKQMVQNHAKVRERGMYFGLQFGHVNVNAPVESILDIVPLKATCAGFADGTILILDLVDQSLMHRIVPPRDGCAVLAMNFVEPTDDPKACLYLWALYAHIDGAFAFMYMIMCEEKYTQQGASVYDQFLSCSAVLRLSSYDAGSVPLYAQTVVAKVCEEDDEPITLCVLSWLGSDRTTTVMVFDLNQWYKAEMPYECDWRDEVIHSVVFKIREPSFHAQLNKGSLLPFRTMQRPEEHFYPSSLAFEIINFNGLNRNKHRWVGLQNKLLQYLEQDGANGVIEPTSLYQVLVRAALIPECYDQLPPEDGSIKVQREFILSLALQYNCHAFLESCVRLWADGSHLGADPERGVSLSTLTDWIWNRSAVLKAVCNQMLAPLLDSTGGRRVEARTLRYLSNCTHMMEQLAALYRTILTDSAEFIPENVMERLTQESTSIALAAEYQKVVQWLLSIGILPELHESVWTSAEDEPSLEPLYVPYPYTRLYEIYRTRREALDAKRNPILPEAPSRCSPLFIDNFIVREFDEESVRKAWRADEEAGKPCGDSGGALYPPESLQKALRVLLIPEVTKERKLMLLLYLFIDIAAVLGEGRYSDILRTLDNLPIVFNLKSTVMGYIHTFWKLDHGNTEMSEDFMASLKDFPKWQRDQALTSMLNLGEPRRAMGLLRVHGCPVSPQLELCTLVQNGYIDRAFWLQRRTPQPDGRQLLWFVEAVLKVGREKDLLRLIYTDEERLLLRSYLRDCPAPVADTLMFGHLLQNAEFVETVQFVDQLARKRNGEVDKYRDIMSLYHKAMDPLSQRLSYLTYSAPKELEPRLADGRRNGPNMEPLSAVLLHNRADFRVRVLHHAVVAVREAAAATDLNHEKPFLNKPGLGAFQCRPTVRSTNVSYPVRVLPPTNKRRLRDCDALFDGGTTQTTRYEDQRKPPSPLLNEEDGFGNARKKRFLGPGKGRASTVGRAGRKYARLDMPVPVIPEFRPMKPVFNFTSAHSDSMSTGGDKGIFAAKSTSHSPSIFLTTPPLARKHLANSGEGAHGHSTASDANESYTPPGILKASQSGQSISTGHHDEEKVLRFELPSGVAPDGSCLEETQATTLDATNGGDGGTPRAPLLVLERPDLDLSGISNDEFYSPEVTMESSSLQQLLGSGGPARRRPLHRSRSGTPTGASKIAIIIEDHVAEDEGQEDCTAMDVDEDGGRDRAEGSTAARRDDCGGERELVTVEEEEDAAEQEVQLDNEPDDSYGLEVIEDECMEPLALEVSDSEAENVESGQPADLHDIFEGGEEEMVEIEDAEEEEEEEDEEEEDVGGEIEVDEVEEIDLDEDGEDDGVEEEEDGLEYGDEEDSVEEEDEEEDGGGDGLPNGVLGDSAEEDGDSSDSLSVLEVIDVSDAGDSYSSSTSSSSSSPPGDGGGEQVAMGNPRVANPSVAAPNEVSRQQANNLPTGSGGSAQLQYEEFYSESVPRALFDADEDDEEEDDEEDNEEEDDEEDVELENERENEGEQPEQNLPAADESLAIIPSDGMDYIQVPTTSSSTHRTEDQESSSSSASERRSQVEDLSVQQQQDAIEVADSSVASVGAGPVRDQYVAGEQWEDGVASTSGHEDDVRVAPSTSEAATTLPAGEAVAAAATVATSAAAAASTTTVGTAVSAPPSSTQATFGQPKNAHELEVPAMNLSVKPDEAHGSSRKNSKGEENGLTEEARALNLSAGQQELAAQLGGAAADNVSSNTENEDDDDDDEDGGAAVADAEAKGDGDDSRTVDDSEPQSSDEAKSEGVSETKQGESMEVQENEPHSSDEATGTVNPEAVEAESVEAESVEAESVETTGLVEARAIEPPNSSNQDNILERPLPSVEEEKVSGEVAEEEKMELEVEGHDTKKNEQGSKTEGRTSGEQKEPQAREETPVVALETSQEEDEQSDPKEALKRPQELMPQHEAEPEASTSTPRANVKTRLMAAMEKSMTTTGTPSFGTPTRRRSVRATSVVPEQTNTPLTPSLSRARRYASMDNVSGATPDIMALPLTPRRSTRASSIAKEPFDSSTPQKRARRQSQSSMESTDQHHLSHHQLRGSVHNSPTEMEPPEPSEASFASSTASSTRQRGRKAKPLPGAQDGPEPPAGGGAQMLSDYSSNRRLTRHQLAVMERSMGSIASTSSRRTGAAAAAERGSKTDVSAVDGAGAESESESIVSNVSNQSSLRSTRSRTTRSATRRSSVETRSNRGGSKRAESSTTTGGQQQQHAVDASEADSDSDHSLVLGSQRSTTHGLEPIAEEGGETIPESTKKRRGRPPKTDK